VTQRPDYPWADGVDLRLFAPVEGQSTRVRIPGGGGSTGAEFEVIYRGATATAEVVAGSSDGHTCTIVEPGEDR
jgi:alpha-D-xyloside xylohydrolase